MTRMILCVSMATVMLAAGCGDDDTGAQSNDANNGADAGNNGTDAGCEPAAEVCDGQDNDCDGEVDEDDADDAQTFYPDSDSDGFGGEAGAVSACEQPQGFITEGGDCDDNDAVVHPGADEVCDNLDNDCDSQVDQGEVAPLDCTNQTGVCAGSTIAVCENSEYATCGADQFGADYVEDDGENWRCDGLDNDCDGAADEACCGDASGVPIPTAEFIGTTDNDQSMATLTPATSGAPDGAAFLAAWRTGQQINLQHVDDAGQAVGNNISFTVDSSRDGSITGLDVATADSGYELAWTGGQILRQESGGGLLETETWLKVRGYTAQLAEDGAAQTFAEHHFNYPDQPDEVHRLHQPQVAAIGDARMVIYGSDQYDLNHMVHAISYSALDRANPDDVRDLSGTGAEMANVLLHPVLETYGSSFVAAWSNSRGGRIRGRSFSQDGTPGPAFDVALANDAGEVPLDIARAGDDELMLVYAKPDGANPPLVGVPVTISTGEVGSEIQLADASMQNSWPAAVATDTDADDAADSLVVAWRRGDDADPAIVVGITDLENPGLITDQRTLKAAGQESIMPVMAAGDKALGAAWLATSQRDRVEFVPVSIDGVAVCQPSL